MYTEMRVIKNRIQEENLINLIASALMLPTDTGLSKAMKEIVELTNYYELHNSLSDCLKMGILTVEKKGMPVNLHVIERIEDMIDTHKINMVEIKHDGKKLENVLEELNFHKIKSANLVDSYKIKVEFFNGISKIADLSYLINKKGFEELMDYSFFKKFKVDDDGFAISWSENQFLEDIDLWEMGIEE